MAGKEYDLYTFVAGSALEGGQSFPLECNCGRTVPISVPMDQEYVTCPGCDSTIKILVVEGDPGYIIGRDASGEPTLLPVQGSQATHPGKLSPEERAEIIQKAKKQMRQQGQA